MKKTCMVLLLSLPMYVAARNVCEFYQNHPSWYIRHLQIAEKSEVSIGEALAIIEIESGFNPYASQLSGIWSWILKPKTTAKGYAQALDGAWGDYKKAAGHDLSRRSHFMESIGFIHWYIDKYKSKFKEQNPYEHYLLYYNGPGNYSKGKISNEKKAKMVQNLTYEYNQALESCRYELLWLYKWDRKKF